MLDQVKSYISERQELSDNKCGTPVPTIVDKFKLNPVQSKNILNQLYIDNFIIIREGINGQLIFLKK